MWVSRIAGEAPEPDVALRQFAHREFRDQHGARRFQALHDGRVVVEDLMLIGLCAEGVGIPRVANRSLPPQGTPCRRPR